MAHFGAAARLGMPRTTLMYKMQKHEISLRKEVRDRHEAKSQRSRPFESDDNIACANGCRNWNFDNDRMLVRPLFTEENEDANSTSQHVTVEYQLAEAL